MSTAEKFILNGQALDKALVNMSMATRAIHADDFYSPHRAIAPGMHVAVNYRYARDPSQLKYMDNTDASSLLDLLIRNPLFKNKPLIFLHNSTMLRTIHTSILDTRRRILIGLKNYSRISSTPMW